MLINWQEVWILRYLIDVSSSTAIFPFIFHSLLIFFFFKFILQLTSEADNSSGGNHDELDFELLGRNRPPYILNTNIYAQDSGHREQQFSLWFDPTYDFHDYGILWNQKQIVYVSPHYITYISFIRVLLLLKHTHIV